jgi:hypothetical protein
VVSIFASRMLAAGYRGSGLAGMDASIAASDYPDGTPRQRPRRHRTTKAQLILQQTLEVLAQVQKIRQLVD